MRKSYSAYLLQVVSEPGEAMYRLSQEDAVGWAAFTAVLPGLLLCVVGGFMSKGDLSAKSMALTLAIRMGAPLVFLVIGAGMCHGLAKHIAGGEGAYRQMLVVYGFSYVVRIFEVFLVLSPRNANLLEFILYLWQGAVIIIGMKEVYGVGWMKSAASGLTVFLILGAVVSIGPLYAGPMVLPSPPMDAEGDPIKTPLTTPNWVFNPGFEAQDAQGSPSGWHPNVMSLPGVSYGQDNKVAHSGKASGFLAKEGMALGRFNTYVQGIGMCPLLAPTDVADWPGLLAKIAAGRDSKDPSPGRGIWKMLKPKAQQAIAKAAATNPLDDAAKAQLLNPINGLLGSADFYDKKEFVGVELPKSAKAFMARGRRARSQMQIQQVNRLVLEAAFPKEIKHFIEAPPTKGQVQASAWLKTKDVTRAVLMLYIAHKGGDVEQLHPKMLTGTHDWTLCTATGKLTEDVNAVGIGIGMWGSGALWIDDVALRTEFPPSRTPRKPKQPKPQAKAATAEKQPSAAGKK